MFLLPRTIAANLEFTHTSYTLFCLTLYTLHGYGLGRSVEDAVLEKFPGARLAIFELSIDGQVVCTPRIAVGCHYDLCIRWPCEGDEQDLAQ